MVLYFCVLVLYTWYYTTHVHWGFTQVWEKTPHLGEAKVGSFSQFKFPSFKAENRNLIKMQKFINWIIKVWNTKCTKIFDFINYMQRFTKCCSAMQYDNNVLLMTLSKFNLTYGQCCFNQNFRLRRAILFQNFRLRRAKITSIIQPISKIKF